MAGSVRECPVKKVELCLNPGQNLLRVEIVEAVLGRGKGHEKRHGELKIWEMAARSI